MHAFTHSLRGWLQLRIAQRHPRRGNCQIHLYWVLLCSQIRKRGKYVNVLCLQSVSWRKVSIQMFIPKRDNDFLLFCSPLPSVQFSHSVMSDSVTPWTSTPGFPVHRQSPELAQAHVHLVGDGDL